MLLSTLVSTLLPLSVSALALPHGSNVNGAHKRRQVAVVSEDGGYETVSIQLHGGLRLDPDQYKTVTHTGVVASVQAGVVNFGQIVTRTAAAAPLPTQTWGAPSNGRYNYPTVNLAPLSRSSRINSTNYAKLTDQLPRILTNGVAITDKSWELGALVQGLLEVYNPTLTSFAYDTDAFNSSNIPWDALKVAISSLYAVDWSGSPSEQRATGDIFEFIAGSNSLVQLHARPLVGGDGSLGDPAANGAGTLLLAQFAHREEVRRLLSMRNKEDYAWATANQWVFLDNGPKSANGTISQREGHFELWADMGYMIPPFFAYMGLAMNDTNLLRHGIEQWTLESSALFDPSAGLWRHVHYWDTRHWCTGQAWMLGGGLRVIASVHAAGRAQEMAALLRPIEDTIAQALYSVLSHLDHLNLVPNYMNDPDPTLSYGDAAGTALIVASVYRFYTLFPSRVNSWLLSQAERAFDGVVAQIDDQGWVHSVVDPDGTDGFLVYPDLEPPMQSPEAQAFTGMMWAARTAAGV